jgi:serine/threonine protein kinase
VAEGEVYKARDTRLDRTVAIKILPEGLAADPDRRRRFEREARAIATLSHPRRGPRTQPPYPTDYAVTADGQRFLVNTVVDQPTHPALTVILNSGSTNTRRFATACTTARRSIT